MRCASWVLGLALVGLISPAPAAARPVPISGTITTTVTLVEDAELVGDVKCEVVGAPCLSFGAPDITLKLNGFTITGRAEPPNVCVASAQFGTTPEDGISIVGQTGATVLGPGRVERFGRQGIIAQSSSHVTVRRVTTTDNCYSGIWVTTVTDSEFSENVSARNAIGSEGFPCGGI
jgi:hypothetical protein